MFTNVAFNTRTAVSGVAAAIVVAFGAATLDQGHLIGAPAGVIEVGEPIALEPETLAMLPEVTVTASRLVEVAQLPEITVRARRLSDAPEAVAMLPEVTVTASRLVEVAQLPEITVRATRLSDAPEAVASVVQLPEVVVLGRRVAMMVADAAQPSKGSSTVGALLK